MGLWWPPAAAYMRPGAPPQSRRYVFTGPGEVSSLVTVPPAFQYNIMSNIIIYRWIANEVLRLFRRYTRTHTHPAFGRVVSLQMRWRWGWKGEWRWDESENEMKDYLSGTRGGERKEEGQSKHQHQHQHTWPRAGKDWKGKGKEKRRPTDTEQDQRRGGEDGSAWTNLTQRKPTPTSARTGNRGPNGGLVGEQKKKQRLNGIQSDSAHS